jgi:hypothetical protein
MKRYTRFKAYNSTEKKANSFCMIARLSLGLYTNANREHLLSDCFPNSAMVEAELPVSRVCKLFLELP